MAIQISPQIDRRVADNAMPFNALTAPRRVADPLNAGREIVVTASVRDDELGRLSARNHISPHHFAVGRHVQRLFEENGAGGVKAMDTTKEPVDGRGQFIDPISDRQIKNGRKLVDAKALLGARNFNVVRAVLSDGISIEQLGDNTKVGAAYFLKRFRESLDKLSEMFGYSGRGR